MKNIKKIIPLLVIIIAAIGVGWFVTQKKPSEPKELTTVRLPIDIWPGNYWIVVADRMGYFEEEGLNAELVDVTYDYNGTVDDFISGKTDELDTHLIAVFDLIDANATGADLVAVLISDSSEGAEGMVAREGYEELEDLRGKRIGVEVGTYLDYFLEVAMQNKDIAADEYTKVNMQTEDMPDKFEEENLDAAFSWEPDLTDMREKYNLHTIFDTSDIRGLSPGIFVFRRTFIESQPETVQKIVNTWYKATNYIMSNKEETAKMVSEIDFTDDLGIYYSQEEAMELYDVDPLLDLNDNLKMWGFETGFESLYGNLQYVSHFIQKNNNIEKMPNINQMLDDRFLHNIKK